MSYELNSDPLQQILKRLAKVNGGLEIKCIKDKIDPKRKIFLIFIRIGVLGHRKSLVENNVKRFEKVNLSEGRINLEFLPDGRMELVGIIRPKNIDKLWIISLGLLKKMSSCIFDYERYTHNDEQSTERNSRTRGNSRTE